MIFRFFLQACIKCPIQIQYQSQSHHIATTVNSGLTSFIQVANGNVLQ